MTIQKIEKWFPEGTRMNVYKVLMRTCIDTLRFPHCFDIGEDIQIGTTLRAKKFKEPGIEYNKGFHCLYSVAEACFFRRHYLHHWPYDIWRCKPEIYEVEIDAICSGKISMNFMGNGDIGNVSVIVGDNMTVIRRVR